MPIGEDPAAHVQFSSVQFSSCCFLPAVGPFSWVSFSFFDLMFKVQFGSVQFSSVQFSSVQLSSRPLVHLHRPLPYHTMPLTSKLKIEPKRASLAAIGPLLNLRPSHVADPSAPGLLVRRPLWATPLHDCRHSWNLA